MKSGITIRHIFDQANMYIPQEWRKREFMSDTTQSIRALKPHVSFNVADVAQSIEFYRKMFGIEPSKVPPGYAKFDVQNPPLNLAMNEIASGAEGKISRLSHLGIQVASTADVLATRERWQA